ncbi:MAG TPA: ABC transporter permease, partial [Bacilli bacterium]|nr:ABC transporter permease [Bacilli bacterium]
MIIKDTFREIKSTYKRFISLLLIAFLGVGFFVGIRSTSPDMEISLNNYYDENNVYDIKIISTAGLDQKDLLALKKIKQVAGAYGTYSFDTLVYDQDIELVTKVTAINDQVNKINLVKGRLPKNNKECVIDAIMINTQNLKIGEQITIDSPYVVNKKQTIVGFVNS